MMCDRARMSRTGIATGRDGVRAGVPGQGMS